MQGKTVVITGATSGIGQVASERLAAMGARIVQVARSQARGEEAMARLRQLQPGAEHRMIHADLSRLSEMKRAAGEIAATEPRIDVLMNNAGALFGTRQITEDGLEKTFALNHLSYFVLTCALLGRLRNSAPSRVVNTSSDAHRGRRLDFDDLQSARKFRGFPVYGRTKLANILFTRELARRLAGSGVTANALHPGFVATRFGDESGGWLSRSVRLAKKLVALTPEQGAETLIYLASSPEVEGVTGRYFHKCRLTTPAREAQDDTAARRLWQESVRLTGMDPDSEAEQSRR